VMMVLYCMHAVQTDDIISLLVRKEREWTLTTTKTLAAAWTYNSLCVLCLLIFFLPYIIATNIDINYTLRSYRKKGW
jgi:hypothetical protein